jgi:uncharacterized membrane protein YqhA
MVTLFAVIALSVFWFIAGFFRLGVRIDSTIDSHDLVLSALKLLDVALLANLAFILMVGLYQRLFGTAQRPLLLET